MMHREEDSIIPGEIFLCPICNEQNQFLMKLTLFGLVFWGGTFCAHADKSKIGKKMPRAEAERFLKKEKKEAEEFASKASNERKENILQFISGVNKVLNKIQRMHY